MAYHLVGSVSVEDAAQRGMSDWLSWQRNDIGWDPIAAMPCSPAVDPHPVGIVTVKPAVPMDDESLAQAAADRASREALWRESFPNDKGTVERHAEVGKRLAEERLEIDDVLAIRRLLRHGSDGIAAMVDRWIAERAANADPDGRIAWEQRQADKCARVEREAVAALRTANAAPVQRSPLLIEPSFTAGRFDPNLWGLV